MTTHFPQLLFAVPHFLRDDEEPYEGVRSLTEALPPGSALAVSHITGEGIGPEQGLAAQRVYQGVSAPAVPRSRQDITRFFDGLHLTPPGLTDICRWPVTAASPEAPLRVSTPSRVRCTPPASHDSDLTQSVPNGCW